VQLDAEWQNVKLAALRAQVTQIQRLVEAMGEERFAAWWRNETFTSASSVPG